MRNHGKPSLPGRNGDWGGGCRCRGEGRHGRDASERSRRVYRVEGRDKGYLGLSLSLGDRGRVEASKSRSWWWGANDVWIRILGGLLVWDGN